MTDTDTETDTIRQAQMAKNAADYFLVELYHLLDGIINLRYKLLCFLTPNKNISKRKALAFNQVKYCNLVLCLGLILLW